MPNGNYEVIREALEKWIATAAGIKKMAEGLAQPVLEMQKGSMSMLQKELERIQDMTAPLVEQLKKLGGQIPPFGKEEK